MGRVKGDVLPAEDAGRRKWAEPEPAFGLARVAIFPTFCGVKQSLCLTGQGITLCKSDTVKGEIYGRTTRITSLPDLATA